MQIDGLIDGQASALDAADRTLVQDARRAARAATGDDPATDQAEAVEEAASLFEGYFSNLLVKEMRKALPEGFFNGSGSDVYGAWFDEHVGGVLAEREALGIAGMIRASLGRRLEATATAGTEPDASPEAREVQE